MDNITIYIKFYVAHIKPPTATAVAAPKEPTSIVASPTNAKPKPIDADRQLPNNGLSGDTLFLK